MFNFSIPSYFIYSPNYSGSSDIVEYLILNGCSNVENDFNAPKLPNVAPLIKRRYSQITKMSVEAASHLIEHEEQIPIFYYSNFGELQSHYEITKMIETSSSVSPSEFSYSTHNTSVGQISILMKNHKRCIAMSDSENTLETALIQINSFMNVSGENKALLIITEEALPEIYKSSYDKNINSLGVFSVGIIISKENTNLRLNILSSFDNNEKCSIFNFLKFLTLPSVNKINFAKSEIVKL